MSSDAVSVELAVYYSPLQGQTIYLTYSSGFTPDAIKFVTFSDKTAEFATMTTLLRLDIIADEHKFALDLNKIQMSRVVGCDNVGAVFAPGK